MGTLTRIITAIKTTTIRVVKLFLTTGGIACAGYLAVVHLPDSPMVQDLLTEHGFRKVQEAPTAPPVNIRVYSQDEMERLVVEVARRKRIHPLVLMAQIVVESNWQQFAIGDNGRSFGLFQIQPKLWRKFCNLKNDYELLDAEKNIECAADIHNENYAKSTGEHSNRLWATYRMHNGSGPMARNYAHKVMAVLNEMLIESTEIG